MKTLGDIIRTYRKVYMEKYHPPPQHLKVLDAIAHCRTSAMGGHAWVCTSCGGLHVHYNSCGNRHCPQCQAFEKEKWVEARKAELLPVPYLHLVFTLPHELNPLVLANDRVIYNLLFKAVWKTIQTISKDKKWLGAQMGMIAVLHTWGSNLSLHPHLHCVIPCGGLNENKTKWIPTRKKGFLAPNKTIISPIFKAIFMKLLTKTFDNNQLHFWGQAQPFEDIKELRSLFKKLYQKNWNVYAKKPFGGPAQILNYLSRYTHRIAISNHRIVGVKNDKVTFSIKNYQLKNPNGQPIIQQLTLAVFEFLRRFLMHVLPKGFQRIRYFGILSIRNRNEKLKNCQRILNYQIPPKNPLDWKKRLQQLTGIDPNQCPLCQQKTLIFIGFLPQAYQPIGRSPPNYIRVVTPNGETIPLNA